MHSGQSLLITKELRKIFDTSSWLWADLEKFSQFFLIYAETWKIVDIFSTDSWEDQTRKFFDIFSDLLGDFEKFSRFSSIYERARHLCKSYAYTVAYPR